MIKSTLTRIRQEDKNTLDELFSTYVKEMTPYVESRSSAVSTVNSKKSFATYFSSDTHWPYFILSDGDVAGFCFIRRYPQELETYDIDQFFILDKYKRRGLGRETLNHLVGLHPGNWLVRVLKKNSPALTFWKNAIGSIVGDNFTTTKGLDDHTEMNFIRFNHREL